MFVAVVLSKDEDAIRAAYRLKDRCFVTRDAKRLRATDVPTFHYVATDGSKKSNAEIWSYMRWRFAHQTACKRAERPVKIVVKGNRARVEVSLTDDFTARTSTGLRREIGQAHGWSEWVRTKAGWRQASLRHDWATSREVPVGGAATR